MKRICTSLLGLLASSLPYTGTSAKMTAVLAVSVEVPDNCTVSTTGGPADGYEATVIAVPSDVEGESALTIDCSDGTAPEVSFNAPKSDASGRVAVPDAASGGGGQSLFVYTIYQRRSRRSTWGALSQTAASVPGRAPGTPSPSAHAQRSAASRSRDAVLFATITF